MLASLSILKHKFSTAIKETRPALIRKLQHQSLKRGTSENGILLGAFASKALSAMTDADLISYQGIIAENDIDLFNWLSGMQEAPLKYKGDVVFQMIGQFYSEKRAASFKN